MRTKLAAILLSLTIATLALIFSYGALRAAPQSPAAGPVFPDQRDAVRQAVYWMVVQFQNDDGGYAAFSSGANQAPSSVAATLDAVLALAAAGYNPAAVFPGEPAAPLGYLTAHEADLLAYAADGGGAGKVVQALVAATVDPRAFLGHDFVALLTGHLDPSGAYGVADPFKQGMAILGVVAAGEAVPANAVAWLEERQAADGSWDDGFGTAGSADATAAAVMGLLAAGRAPGDPAIDAATAFLATARQPAGWPYGSGLAPSANSTALVVQALSALGEDFYSAGGPWANGGVSPLAALLAYQSASGAFQSDFGQGPFDDFYATVQAIPAAAGRPFPLPGRLEAARHALDCLNTLQATAGGWPAFAGRTPDAAGTSRAIQAIVALGEDPTAARWTTPGSIDAVEALAALTPAYLSSGRGGRVGIVLQGIAAAGPPHDPANFGGQSLPLLMTSYLSPTGEYDSTAFGIFAHAEAMLGLLAAGEPVAPSAVDFLLSADVGGDWGDPDSNGIALQLLGRLSRPVPAGTTAALRATQTVDGGWGFGGIANANASAEVVQGLTAVGLDPFGPAWSRIVNGRLAHAADAIMAQQGKNGCWPNLFGPGDDPYATTDAVLLLTQQPSWGFATVYLPAVTYKP